MTTSLYFLTGAPVFSPAGVVTKTALPKGQHKDATITADGCLGTIAPGGVNFIDSTVVAYANTTQQSYYFGRFSTLPLSAQTIPAQVWTWSAIVGEGATSGNTYYWPVLYIYRPSNGNIQFIQCYGES